MKNPLNINALSIAEPKEGLKICVTIPAKNEELLIDQTLSAFLEQNKDDPEAFEVIVLINHSSDHTFKFCRDFKATHPDFPIHILATYSDMVCHVGAARKELMDLAFRRLPCDNGLIAMTDADTLVSKNWISNLQKYGTTDIDLICGTIDINSQDLNAFTKTMYEAKEQYLHLRCRLEDFWLPEPWNTWPKHASSAGPNMAIKKSAYQKIGGIPALACLEDSALYDRVVTMGLKVKHALDIPVETSARLTSRVQQGFGCELSYWSRLNGEPYLYAVEGLEKLNIRFRAFSVIKEAYQKNCTGDFSYLASQLKLPVSVLHKLYIVHSNYQSMNRRLISLLEKHKDWQLTHPNISVFEANKELRTFFNDNTTAQPVFCQSTSS